jgi:hypothetical protein
MSEEMQGNIVIAVVAVVMIALIGFVTVRDHVGLENSLHCATCSP